MATNGTNGSKRPSKARAPSIKRRPLPRPTAAQQRARAEYVRTSGHEIDPERIAKIIAQWDD